MELPQELVDLHSHLALIGLTTYEDRAYCHHHARSIYTGEGEIVELGCWLGSLTSALALGIAENPRPEVRGKRVHAYDRFTWTEWMATLPPPLNPERFHAGDSFRGAFEARIEPWRERVAVHEGDLLETGFPGGAIELLVVDAMKSWDLTSAILREFYPRLLPGSGFVLHQDFAHEAHPWIHLVSYRLRDCFELVFDIPRSDSVVFRCTRAVPARLLGEDYSWESFARSEIEEAFAYSHGLVSDDKRQAVEAARRRALEWA